MELDGLAHLREDVGFGVGQGDTSRQVRRPRAVPAVAGALQLSGHVAQLGVPVLGVCHDMMIARLVGVGCGCQYAERRASGRELLALRSFAVVAAGHCLEVTGCTCALCDIRAGCLVPPHRKAAVVRDVRSE